MPRPKSLNPPIHVSLWIKPEVHAQVHILCHSEARGYVPRGDISRFYERAVERELERIRKEISDGATTVSASGSLEAEGNREYDNG
mgnify:CR=1